jgi:hypothetical protein
MRVFMPGKMVSVEDDVFISGDFIKQSTTDVPLTYLNRNPDILKCVG